MQRLRMPGADIPDLGGALGRRRGVERFGDVGRVQEIPALRAVADDGERLAGELLAQEHAEHGAVGTRGPGPPAVGVEDADRFHRQLVDLAPVKTGRLALEVAKGYRVLRGDPRALPVL